MENIYRREQEVTEIQQSVSAVSLLLAFSAVKKSVIICIFLFLHYHSAFTQTNVRQNISLNENWQTIATTDNKVLPANTYQVAINKNWKTVNIPHNWDTYEGYRRLLHGNRHGDSWYRKTFSIKRAKTGKRFFLFFEGVSSYATVFLNGKKIGEHVGGRTTFTLDATDQIKTDGSANQVAVRAYHPSNIKNLPWVCGGCSDERGFSEGSQPMGIFRPVHLVVTNEVRIEPFGIHAWSDSTVTGKSALVNTATSIKNYGSQKKSVSILQELQDKSGQTITTHKTWVTIQPGEARDLRQQLTLTGAKLWSVDDPYLYQIRTVIQENGRIADELYTPYGIRSIKWSHTYAKSSNQFLLNGKPVFINGIAEYEHQLGNSHAFTDEQVSSRVRMIKAAGFNAFRDAHQPHNLRYQHYWDSMGVLSWTQLSAHVWYDTKEFREQFKQNLKEWVIERRNSPSVVLWGLQNESKLSKDFAEECVALIRSLDPTASSQRLVTVCNGGEGTDWNVPQNWTGTYGGDPATYSADLKKQILVGEYGAWRTIDLHTEHDASTAAGYSEDKMTQLMETKVRLAEAAKDSVAGHFAWLLTSHDNPGRVQGGEGHRELDRVGPVNYKGLLTPWEEPLDVFYMYRSNYTPKETAPMVYIVSHTWPGRWTTPGIKNNIIVYSNCDEVELFNDVNASSLGRKKRGPVGTHYRWDSVHIEFNVLYAVGYVNGKPQARDTIVLHHLPKAPGLHKLYSGNSTITKPQPGYNYVCRVNCGGPAYKDEHGSLWAADRTGLNASLTASGRGLAPSSTSWTNQFPEMPAYFASQRKTYNVIQGTKDWPLFQAFRYGRDELAYNLPVQDGKYLVELYFAEPWWGVGGGMDCTGFRLFDVAINDKTVLLNLDIWKEAGTNTALRKSFEVSVTGGQLKIAFPNVRAGQAIISAIAVATLNKNAMAVPLPGAIITEPETQAAYNVQSWLDAGDRQFLNSTKTFVSLPASLFGAEWISFRENASGEISFNARETMDIHIAIDSSQPYPPEQFADTKTFLQNDALVNNTFQVYKRRIPKGERLRLDLKGVKGIFFVPASGMQPAYDLKPVVAYRPTAALLPAQGINRVILIEKDALTFTRNDVAIQWQVSIGAADIYSLTLRYSNPSDKNLSGRVEIVTAEGAIFKSERIVFSPSKAGKWSYAAINTGTMINAGNYTVRVVADKAVGVSVSALDLQ